MLNVNGTTRKGSQKVDLSVVEQIVTLALESCMWLLLNLELDVTGLYAWHLITLPTEVNLGAALHTTVDVNVEDLALDDGLLAIALLALVLLADLFTLAVAVWTDSLETLNHGTHLAHHCLHTLAVAARTCLDSALLTTSSIALGADDRLLQSELRDLSAVNVLE